MDIIDKIMAVHFNFGGSIIYFLGSSICLFLSLFSSVGIYVNDLLLDYFSIKLNY